MNKTLEQYRKLAESYKQLGFGDYAIVELWTALDEVVLANTELAAQTAGLLEALDGLLNYSFWPDKPEVHLEFMSAE